MLGLKLKHINKRGYRCQKYQAVSSYNLLLSEEKWHTSKTTNSKENDQKSTTSTEDMRPHENEEKNRINLF